MQKPKASVRGDITTAFRRALATLRKPGALWLMLSPTLIAAAVWLLIAIGSWGALFTLLSDWAAGSWLGVWSAKYAITSFFLTISLHLLITTLYLLMFYISAIIVFNAYTLPKLFELTAREEYADIEQRRGGSNLVSLRNTVSTTAVFLIVMLICFPLLLVPGLGFILILLMTAWLNKKTFTYDALMQYADRQELDTFPRRYRCSLYLLAILCALLAYIPFINLLAPALTGLAFVHFSLTSLRQWRHHPQMLAAFSS